MTKEIDINGFIEIKDNPISKIGIYEYYGHEIGFKEEPNKLFKVFRSEKSLKDAVDFFKGKPIVDNHTMLGDKEVDPEKKGIHGVVGDEVYYKEGSIYGNIRLYTKKIKNLIDQGKKELSFGYWSNYVKSRGFFEGARYDVIQTIVGGNHLALIDQGRMGETVAVMDSIKLKGEGMDEVLEQLKLIVARLDKLEATETKEVKAAKTKEVKAAKDEEVKAAKDEEVKAAKTKEVKAAKDEEVKAAKDEEVKAAKDEEVKAAKDEEVKAAETKATTDAIAKKVTEDLAASSAMYAVAQPLVGTFDHVGKSAIEIADYAAKKLGLDGDSATAVRTYAKLRAMKTEDHKPTDVVDSVLNAGVFE